MKLWFVAETIRNRQDEAALSVTPLGMEAYVPALTRFRKRGHAIVEEETPRFGTYIFVRFQRDATNTSPADPWPELIHGVSRKKYFQRILCDLQTGIPIPVPERAMQAIMSYTPPRIGDPTPIVFQEGQEVYWTDRGVRIKGYFVRYKGNRQFIRAWIFGSDRICEVRKDQLEPVEAARLSLLGV